MSLINPQEKKNGDVCLWRIQSGWKRERDKPKTSAGEILNLAVFKGSIFVLDVIWSYPSTHLVVSFFYRNGPRKLKLLIKNSWQRFQPHVKDLSTDLQTPNSSESRSKHWWGHYTLTFRRTEHPLYICAPLWPQTYTNYLLTLHLYSLHPSRLPSKSVCPSNLSLTLSSIRLRVCAATESCRAATRLQRSSSSAENTWAPNVPLSHEILGSSTTGERVGRQVQWSQYCR